MSGSSAPDPACRRRIDRRVEIPQHSRWAILAVWAAAALPMAALAWLVAPAVADRLSGEANVPLVKALTASLTAGLVWQFVLVMILVAREQRTVRWSVLRDALWLLPPRSPRTGRVGGRLWLLVVPLSVGFAVAGLLPLGVGEPESRNVSAFLESDAGQGFFISNWAWFAMTLAMMLFNTVLGEELLFRGLLLPRMRGAFGRADWVVNGVLFGIYHLHQPWSVPGAVARGLMAGYATRRLRSAWLGVIAHSAQSVVFLGLTLAVVLAT
jgi:membrane protease YdiL (CAAX protease family)